MLSVMEDKENEPKQETNKTKEVVAEAKLGPKPRRSVLKEFDPFTPESPCVPKLNRKVPLIEEDIYEDAETSLNKEPNRVSLLLPDLSVARETLNDTIDLSYTDACENISSRSVNQSANELTEDSVEFKSLSVNTTIEPNKNVSLGANSLQENADTSCCNATFDADKTAIFDNAPSEMLEAATESDKTFDSDNLVKAQLNKANEISNPDANQDLEIKDQESNSQEAQIGSFDVLSGLFHNLKLNQTVHVEDSPQKTVDDAAVVNEAQTECVLNSTFEVPELPESIEIVENAGSHLREAIPQEGKEESEAICQSVEVGAADGNPQETVINIDNNSDPTVQSLCESVSSKDAAHAVERTDVDAQHQQEELEISEKNVETKEDDVKPEEPVINNDDISEPSSVLLEDKPSATQTECNLNGTFEVPSNEVIATEKEHVANNTLEQPIDEEVKRKKGDRNKCLEDVDTKEDEAADVKPEEPVINNDDIKELSAHLLEDNPAASVYSAVNCASPTQTECSFNGTFEVPSNEVISTVAANNTLKEPIDKKHEEVKRMKEERNKSLKDVDTKEDEAADDILKEPLINNDDLRELTAHLLEDKPTSSDSSAENFACSIHTECNLNGTFEVPSNEIIATQKENVAANNTLEKPIDKKHEQVQRKKEKGHKFLEDVETKEDEVADVKPEEMVIDNDDKKSDPLPLSMEDKLTDLVPSANTTQTEIKARSATEEEPKSVEVVKIKEHEAADVKPEEMVINNDDTVEALVQSLKDKPIHSVFSKNAVNPPQTESNLEITDEIKAGSAHEEEAPKSVAVDVKPETVITNDDEVDPLEDKPNRVKLQRQDTQEFEQLEKECERETFRLGSRLNQLKEVGECSAPQTAPLTIRCKPSIRSARDKIQVIASPTFVNGQSVPNACSARNPCVHKVIVSELVEENREHKQNVACYQVALENYQTRYYQQAAELDALRTDLDVNLRSLKAAETSFSQVVQRYEMAKDVIEKYIKNEDILQKNLESAVARINEYDVAYAVLKQECLNKDELTRKQIEEESEKHRQDIAKLQALAKRRDIKTQYLESALKQKTEECQNLAALCDSLTDKVI